MPPMPTFLRSTPPPLTREIGPRSGLIHSDVPGRTDRIGMNARPNSYIVPADIVSGIGQGNSLAGAKILEQALKSGPYGTKLPKLPHRSTLPKPPRALRFAAGGDAPDTPIVTAGGEFVVEPDVVAALGGGDLKRGHSLLDGMVVSVRKQIVQQMKQLPGPKR